MKIEIKKLNENAIIPTRGSQQAAGYDLYAATTEPITIQPHETAKIGTGLAIAVPDGYFGAIFARSGLAAKQGLRALALRIVTTVANTSWHFIMTPTSSKPLLQRKE